MRKNNSLETIEQELDKLKKENHGQMTPEEQIQWEYLTGVSLDYSAVLTHSYNEVSKAIPYVERALEILAPYPLQDRVHFEILCHYELADLYTTVENKKAVDEVNKMIELHKQWNHLNTTFDRRFLDESHYYMAKYSQIIFMADLISKEEIKDYYQKYIQIANKKKVVKSTYETTARYYQTIGEYKKAIAYIDSATQTDHFQPVNLVPILNAKAGLYYKLNDYKNAYLTLKESNKNRMSDKSQKREQQMIEMQTRFDVNKLELEKSKLANKNKQIALTGTFILLLAAIGWSIYQRTMVKRLKKMHCALMTAHEEVRKQSMKATESEKMKTAFLRQLIQSNSTAIASLMDNMLELSQLVSSELPLPVESTDVYGLCVEEMAKLKETLSKPNIECIITGDKDGMTAQTNAFYLSRVIGNLLSNSAKFTESGTITLTCNIDKEKGQLVISVTDTGIGIPADKQEWVFERFTKVDDFKPGTGLGLYICRIIIQRLGGQIRIDTGYTSGCKMVVTLPV